MSPEVLASVAGLALVCTALAFVLFFELIVEVGPARSTVITYVNPGVAILLGVVVLGEPLTWGIVLGFPLILLGWGRATAPPPAGPAHSPRAAEPPSACGWRTSGAAGGRQATGRSGDSTTTGIRRVVWRW